MFNLNTLTMSKKKADIVRMDKNQQDNSMLFIREILEIHTLKK